MGKHGTPGTAWDYSDVTEPKSYGGDDGYATGMKFLDRAGTTVEDWGCGTTYARKFLKNAEYRGVDFTPSAFVDVVSDLLTYRSSPDAIFMRGVLEHNPDWRTILCNARDSFKTRMAIVTFVPFEDEDRVIDAQWPTLALSQTDFDLILQDLTVKRIDLETESEYGRESVFLCTRKDHDNVH